MDELEIINWSAVAREAIREKAEQLKFLRNFSKDSELTKEEAVELGREVNKKLSKKYKKK